MKKLIIAAVCVSALAGPALADGPAQAVMDPVVIVEDTMAASSSSGVAIVALMGLLLLGTAMGN